MNGHMAKPLSFDTLPWKLKSILLIDYITKKAESDRRSDLCGGIL